MLTATQEFSGINATDTVLVTVNHLSVGQNATNAVCYGTNTGVIVATAASGSGNYTYNWSNGNLTPTNDSLAAGIYTLTVLDNTTGCSVVLADTILQPAMPLMASIAAPDTLTCIVHSVVLAASSTTSGVFYNWSNGINGPSDTVTTGGDYLVLVTDTLFGCATSDSVTVQQTSIHGSITINASLTGLCPGDSAHVCGPVGFAGYLWNTGDTSACVVSKQAGSLYLTVQDSLGCLDTSNHISIQAFTPAAATIISTGDTLSVSNSFSTYQWELNGNIISGATQSTYVVGGAGSYSVLVTDSDGCSVTSAVFVISGISRIEPDKFNVFPNPLVSGAWTLEVGITELENGLSWMMKPERWFTGAR